VKILKADGIEIQLDYCPIDFRKEEQKEEWFREIHPAGKTPAIKDEETKFCLGESRAIFFYLLEKYGKGTKWWPKTVEDQAMMIRSFYANGGLFNIIDSTVCRKVINNKKTPDTAWINVANILQRYDEFYESHEDVTLLDIYIHYLCDFGKLLLMKTGLHNDKCNLPNLAKLHQKVKSLPGFNAVNDSYFNWIRNYRFVSQTEIDKQKQLGTIQE